MIGVFLCYNIDRRINEKVMAGGDKRIRIDDDGVDRFTELPVNLREHILDCLSIKDAVATSVLSSKWRYCWTGLRKLNFDYDFWYTKNYFTWGVQYLEQSERVKAIDIVLMLHFGPIREFILSIPNIIKHKMVNLNMWLHVLSNNGVRKIVIYAQYENRPFPMPLSLFHCRELQELSLCNCKVTLPSDFKGFSNLTSLSLDDVDIASSILGSLISRCPLLETLSITYLVLKEPLALEALNIKTFYFNGRDIGKIVFKDVPKLTCVTLLKTGETEKLESYNTLNQLCSLSKIKDKDLTFDFRLLEPLSENCLRSTLTPLENLKSLTLRSIDLCLSSDVLLTLYLMGSAPNLRNLTLRLDSRVCWDDDRKLKRDAAKLLKAEAKKRTSYNNLQTIKIRGLAGLPHESLLIKLLQKRCQKSVSIIIETGGALLLF